MTILPKKKTTKEKNEAEKGEHSSSAVVEHGRNRSRNSPPRWLPSVPRDDSTSHDPGGASAYAIDTEYPEFETCPPQQPAVNVKRRHRSPPHTSHSRRKHKDRHGEPKSRHQSEHVNHSEIRHAHCHTPTLEIHEHIAVPTSSKSTDEEVNSGYNSGDEYGSSRRGFPTDDLQEIERFFETTMKEQKGLVIKKMAEDGACLFRAVADQVYGDQEMNSVVRKHCLDYMAKNRDHFAAYITEDFNTYLNRKRTDSCHGNHIEIQAMAEMYNRPIEVYQYSVEPINSFHGAYKTENEPIRLSYHGSVHYNSLIDPYKATVGVGLGLPGYKPGSADKSLMDSAVKKSEDVHIEQCMLEDKIRETDWELTQDTIEEQVARESYLQWLRDNEKKGSSAATSSSSATCSSSTATANNWWDNLTSPTRSPTQTENTKSGRSPRNRSTHSSPHQSPHNAGTGSPPDVAQSISPVKTCDGSTLSEVAAKEEGPPPDGAVSSLPNFTETSSIMDTPSAFGFSEMDEDEILAQVMAQSQQEYMDSFKKNANPLDC